MVFPLVTCEIVAVELRCGYLQPYLHLAQVLECMLQQSVGCTAFKRLSALLTLEWVFFTGDLKWLVRVFSLRLNNAGQDVLSRANNTQLQQALVQTVHRDLKV